MRRNLIRYDFGNDPERAMTEAGQSQAGGHQIVIQEARERLRESGGYEIVHQSPGLELGVYMLVAPEPDRQQPHEDDEVYIVLDGRGTLEVEGTRYELTEGDSVFVPAGAEHSFVGYEELCVLVIFEKRPK